VLTAELLAALVPRTALWRDWVYFAATEAAERSELDHRGAAKALTVLLVEEGGVNDNALGDHHINTHTQTMGGGAVADVVARHVGPTCAAARCVLPLQAASEAFAGVDGRGALQAALAVFLRRCPTGLVVLQGLHMLPPAALPALLPMLSEEGAYLTDGVAVPATAATVLLTAALPADVAAQATAEAAEEREAAFAAAAKAALETLLRSVAEAAGVAADDAHSFARALRRRIDLVAPLQLEHNS